MDINEKNMELISSIAEEKNLEPFEHHFSGHGPDLYNVTIYGFKQVEMFEFFWYSNEDVMTYNLFVDLGDLDITDDLFKKIQGMFSNNDLALKDLMIDKGESFISITGSFDKVSCNKKTISQILDFFNKPDPVITSLIDLMNYRNSDTKSKSL